MTAEEQEDIRALTDTVKRFAVERLAPNIEAWETAGSVPREVHREAAALGLLGLGYPEEFGGTPASHAMRIAMSTALARYTGSGGVTASLFSHNIGVPPVLRYGSKALQGEYVPPALRGETVVALAITEPGGGSDVASLHTTARRDGDDWVIDGEKTFITSGMRADWATMAVRTGESRGASGISMIVVPLNTPGVTRQPLAKMGWLCSDTAHIRLDGVRVPARNLLGSEGGGFRIIMTNFNGERLSMSALSLGFAQACYDEALDWARQRVTFGAPLVERQVIRHKLVDMQMRIASTQAWLDSAVARADDGDRLETDRELVAQVCMLKNHATQAMQFCADQAVQILGGMGFMRGTRSERIYREVKVMMIGGGAEEIMKDLAARQLGL